MLCKQAPNGWRYPQVSGRGDGFEAGKNLKSVKGLKNAQTPTCRVHAVLGEQDLNASRVSKTSGANDVLNLRQARFFSNTMTTFLAMELNSHSQSHSRLRVTKEYQLSGFV